MKKFILLILAIFLVSCSAQRQLIRIGCSMRQFKIGYYTPIYNYQVMDILEPNFFLAIGGSSDKPSVIAVSVLDEEGPFYNHQLVEGPYVMIDTFSYETQAHSQMTVPLVVSLKHYQMLKNTEKQLERKDNDREVKD